MLLLLHPASPSSPCFAMLKNTPTNLNLTNRSHQCRELDWDLFQEQSHVQLSRNCTEALSPSFRVTPGLKELDLSHNQLLELPADFFANATALQTLCLESSPLSAVPPATFQASLRFLAVPCRHNIVSSTLAPCTCSPPSCTVPQCLCHMSHDGLNATNFHDPELRQNVRLIAGSVGAAAWGRAAGGHRRGSLPVEESGYRCCQRGWNKREPTAAQGQPRYISRDTEIGTTDATTSLDYENIFVSPTAARAATQGWTPGWQEKQYSPQVPVDDNYFLESEPVSGDQPIYANVQNHSEDNIYIVPGQ
ncbi:LOW QUALITY PROTEIN: leucine-rich repeat-containing protein 25 [Phalacrocorax aristotelis]|uniref:LOW QUALITY PROTEIN: leucine-rich repeat-containing protein 25 n=1 Tax=Phalacrocorax aristotelis TaxID=126867 RepID=UPI003F4B4274